jgi:hypothetical protein
MNRHHVSILLAVIFCLVAAQAIARDAQQQPVPQAKPVVGLFDELQELYPDTKLDKPIKRLSVDVARNTIAATHLMITGLQGTEKISFVVSDDRGRSISAARWYRMIDVPVAENTGLDRNTEKYSGMINPYVIRRAPFRTYDPFRPITSPIAADSSTLVLRLEIPIEPSSMPGKYVHRIKVDLGDCSEVVEFIVTVHRALVPPVNRSTISYINWMNLDNICRAHGVEKWSEPFWSMLSKYAQTMARGRQNAFWFIWGDYFAFDSTGNVTSFRRDRLERLIKLFFQQDSRRFRVRPLRVAETG